VARKPVTRVIPTDVTAETKSEGKPKEKIENANRSPAIT
jgi:hypothetical protein